MWFAPLLKGTISLIVSGLAVEKIVKWTESPKDNEISANPNTEGIAMATYQRSWFDENMFLLAACGVFCAFVIFDKKK